MIEVSIILPTLNEEKNLDFLIPEIQEELTHLNIENYEIIVVDDGSTDNSKKLVEQFNNKFKNIYFIERTGEKSLPHSLLEGIDNARFSYVMWLDADGSMPAPIVSKLISIQNENLDKVIVGSRFVEGGGYKGIKKGEDTSFLQIISNIYNSEDSILVVFLSKLFNKLLSKILKLKVKDLTSGFIIGKKEYFNRESFLNASYGDYFIMLMLDLNEKKVECLEVPYFCDTRKFGESKTGSNYKQLIKRGLPYLKLAFKLSRNNGKNN